MKNLLNLEGVKALSKMEQKSINGSYLPFSDGACDSTISCSSDSDCPGSCTCQGDELSGTFCK